MSTLSKSKLSSYTTNRGVQYKQLNTSYQVFGKKLHIGPVVVVIHALTGNSDLTSNKKGWWKEIVGKGKLIDTEKFSVISFNIPGNGYDGQLIDNYKDFTAKDIAQIFYSTLTELNIDIVFAISGGSLGGGIAWEMACLYPSFAKYIIPIASHWKSSDWIIGHNSVQKSILLNSKQPLADARKMAMLFYRTPLSFSKKFNRTKVSNSSLFNVESWLNHHGEKLNQRFHIKAYLMMNHLLSTIDAVPEGETTESTFSKIESTIIQIGINSDLFFVPEENRATQKMLNKLKVPNKYYEIKSTHGHDAFLIEQEQITQFLQNTFNKN